MGTPILQVENLTFQYDKRFQSKVISNVSFVVEKGEWLAVVGNNGSGKSTLAQILVGLLVPKKGRIIVSGVEMNEETKWDIRRQIGLVFQNPDNQFIGTTVQDDVAFGLENMNMPYDEMKARVDKALEMVDMSTFCMHDPSSLSGGQKQRVAIAGALAFNPSIIILDEALVMLDPQSRRTLLSTLQKLKASKNLTIISITHDMNEVAEADRMLLMKLGEVVNSGQTRQVFSEERDLEPPFAEALRRNLQARGRNVPVKYTSENEMVRWLCK